MSKYIFVTGGVTSSLGKGITAASIGKLMKECGFKTTIKKMDPYLNLGAAQLSAEEHGEIFYLEDGTDADLDLGHYERFLNEELTKNNTVTTGKIYQKILEKELRGEYNGKTVQVVPHVTDEIKKEIFLLKDYEIVIVEIGGTVGDIEGLPFLEAVRQIRATEGSKNVLFVHVTLLPYISAASELKTKPTQHSIKELRSIGIQPDILICRTQRKITEEIRNKLSNFCNVDREAIIENRDVKTVYEVPIYFQKQGLHKIIYEKLDLTERHKDLDARMKPWKDMIKKMNDSLLRNITIAIVGNYVEVQDSYLSIKEAVRHAAAEEDVTVSIILVNINDDLNKTIEEADGVIFKREKEKDYETLLKIKEICGGRTPLFEFGSFTEFGIQEIQRKVTAPWTTVSDKYERLKGGNIFSVNYRADLMSRPCNPDPEIQAFVMACKEYNKNRGEEPDENSAKV